MSDRVTSDNDEAKKEEGRVVPKLFPYPDENGRYVYADEIAKVVIDRQFPGMGGKTRRVRMSKSEFKLSDGSMFEINPFTMDEEDLEEAFGGGEYFIQPSGFDGRRLINGRTIVLPGKMRPGIRESYMGATFKSDDEPSGEAEKNNVAENNGMMAMLQQMVNDSNKRAEALATQVAAMQQEALRQQFAAQQNRPAPDADAQAEVVRSLRSQIEQLMVQHRNEMDAKTKSAATEIEAKSKTVEDERAAMRRSIESIQEDYNAKRRGLEAELQQERNKREMEMQQSRAARDMEVARDRTAHEEEIRRIREEHRRALDAAEKRIEEEHKRVDEERKRGERDADDERKKRLNEVEDLQRRMQLRINELEKQNSDIRIKYEKQLMDAMKENIDLRKDLADTPLPAEPPPPPSNNSDSSGVNKDDPWFYRALNTWGPPIAKAVAEYSKNAPAIRPNENPQPQIQAPPRFAPQPQQQQFQQAPQPQYQPQPMPQQQQQFQPAPQPPSTPALEPFVPPMVPFDPNVTYGPAMTFGDGEEPAFARAETGEQIEGGGWMADVEPASASKTAAAQ